MPEITDEGKAKMTAFEKWWAEYTSKDGNEVLSDYEKDVARDAWEAAEALKS